VSKDSCRGEEKRYFNSNGKLSSRLFPAALKIQKGGIAYGLILRTECISDPMHSVGGIELEFLASKRIESAGRFSLQVLPPTERMNQAF